MTDELRRRLAICEGVAVRLRESAVGAARRIEELVDVVRKQDATAPPPVTKDNTVHALIEHWEHEGSELRGIYADETRARKEADDLNASDDLPRRCSYSVKAVVVQ